MSTLTQPELLPINNTAATFASESEKLKELFNDPTIDVERFIKQQEVKHQLNLNNTAI